MATTRIMVPGAENSRTAFRGVGEVYVKDPIACVVEVLRRAPAKSENGDWDGKTWRLVPPFTGIPQGSRYAFAIMSATTTTTIKRGNRDVPAREPHPKFASFNSCHPDLAATLPCKIVHFEVEKAWRFQLGAYQAPNGQQNPPDGKGWWCRGDAKEAVRFVNGEFRKIPCPGRKCEFQQACFGRNGDQPHCKPNLSLIGQFAWSEKSTLPRTIFQWDSKSWNNYGNVEGMFELVRKTAADMKLGRFPVFGLPFSLTVKETKKRGGRNFPEVDASIEGDPMEWMGKVIQLMQGPGLQLDGPPPLRELPPATMSQEDVDRASEAALTPTYRPANER